ncbi:YecA family protein [Ignatzschineria cameli]|uniref:YecA family protein n=1 Tax=Ignatzschineria cameli TaxID=2182793 RepID=A0A2U2AS05_9GAMM|nr:YecA family protein [Ignatzschineria cameli]PWD86607.1 hypothetical protein DC080_02965 [Ignatzschineria cameli]PWD87040.1 hypothetical protein DC077_04295 [Ignatzschineria cameli]PWD92013.1 hypothetical protein DC079_01230 [Ignatzschineria cameli]PWD93402.1 hypothetical protein DC081_00955 [Ignatzschineria cameli]PWD94144.1 hypothetical protein DC078_00955 [Ignatzschineria cameli]
MSEAQIPQSVTYELLQQQFPGLNLSEAQGLLIALLCGESLDYFHNWLVELEHIRFDEAELNQEILKILYEKSVAELNSDDFNLSLLLPEEPLENRIEGFIKWCHGFSYGFGLSSDLYAALDEDGREYIRYIIEFSALEKSQVVEELADESDYLALEELIEFVRVGALMLYYHLKGRDDREEAVSQLH